MPWVYLENPKRSAMLCKSAAMRRRRRTPLGALAGWALGARRDHSFMDTNSPAEAQLGCVWAEPPGWWRRIPCHRCHAFDDAKPGFQECEPTILSAKRDARLTVDLGESVCTPLMARMSGKARSGSRREDLHIKASANAPWIGEGARAHRPCHSSRQETPGAAPRTAGRDWSPAARQRTQGKRTTSMTRPRPLRPRTRLRDHRTRRPPMYRCPLCRCRRGLRLAMVGLGLTPDIWAGCCLDPFSDFHLP
ncbi:unnamed protein product [Durusdinium trenchii]|uniref:Uncharacterized protein n=1 Tax=Durusdinium trenchii TaxID=1381693 RepID=A0ABP0P4L5_9DINO